MKVLTLGTLMGRPVRAITYQSTTATKDFGLTCYSPGTVPILLHWSVSGFFANPSGECTIYCSLDVSGGSTNVVSTNLDPDDVTPGQIWQQDTTDYPAANDPIEMYIRDQASPFFVSRTYDPLRAPRCNPGWWVGVHSPASATNPDVSVTIHYIEERT